MGRLQEFLFQCYALKPRQKGGTPKVGIINLAVVERCIAEADIAIVFRDVQSMQDKIAGADGHVQIFAVSKFIVGIKKRISGKGCANDVGVEFGEKETSALPVKIISPAIEVVKIWLSARSTSPIKSEPRPDLRTS